MLVDYAVKVPATCADVITAVSLRCFPVDDGDWIEVSPVVVEPPFLNFSSRWDPSTPVTTRLLDVRHRLSEVFCRRSSAVLLQCGEADGKQRVHGLADAFGTRSDSLALLVAVVDALKDRRQLERRETEIEVERR